MTELSAAFTAIGRWLVRFVIRCVKCKSISIFGLFLILAIIFNAVSPTSPLLLLFVLASYISGAVLVFWAFSILLKTKD